MKIFKGLLPALIFLLIFTACNTKKADYNEHAAEVDTEEVKDLPEERGSSLILTKVDNSPMYEDAILEMNTPGEGEQLEAGSIPFDFTVKNYELTAKTADADIKQCANSGKGQHIHLILNNQPYAAHYDSSFEKELEADNYVSLAFLSRSYHESLKEPNAFVLRQFSVGDVEPAPVDLTQPHMFYSRPKGTYTGDDTKKILLDFYLVNTEISANGNKVRATINGEEFMITEWAPYFVEGLPMGENTFKLELLDADGNLIDGPYNTVERTVNLSLE